MLDSMRLGNEQAHQKWVLDYVDARGADVTLLTGELTAPIRQTVPYLALAWSWRSYLSSILTYLDSRLFLVTQGRGVPRPRYIVLVGSLSSTVGSAAALLPKAAAVHLY